MLHIANKYDVAGRDERNRALGRAGETLVMAHERAVLAGVGRVDLAHKVRWASEEGRRRRGATTSAASRLTGSLGSSRGEDHERMGAHTFPHLAERAGGG